MPLVLGQSWDVLQVVYDLVEKTKFSFQPSMFQCRKFNKLQQILITAVPGSGSHTTGKFLNVLKKYFVLC